MTQLEKSPGWGWEGGGGWRREILENKEVGLRQSLVPMKKRAKDEVLLGAIKADSIMGIRYPPHQRDTKAIDSK